MVASAVQDTQLQALTARAHQLLGQGQTQQALTAFQTVLQLRPGYIPALLGVARTLFMSGRLPNTVALCDEVLGQTLSTPHKAEALRLKGAALEQQQQFSEALQCISLAASLAPESAALAASHAGLLERLNLVDQAFEVAERGLEQWPDQTLFRLILSRCLRRQGDPDRARTLLEKLPLQTLGAQATPFHYELARVYETLQEPEQAWHHFCRGNELTRQGLAPAQRQYSYLDYLDAILAFIDSGGLESLHRAAPVTDAPVQFLGFPRTGSTLLEQILDSHPALASLEEKPLLHAAASAIPALKGELNLSRLTEMSSAQWDNARDKYLASARQYLGKTLPPGHRLVDKNPLNTPNIPLLYALFPGAQYLFLTRHPLDTCLSCFQQAFVTNAGLENFLSMDTTVDMFDKVMRIWQSTKTVLDQDALQVRYESLVQDFDGTVSAITTFLGLEYRDDMRDFDTHARQRMNLTTPSYHQVTQKLYTSAMDKWRLYERQLKPWRDRLEPWCEYFGYAL